MAIESVLRDINLFVDGRGYAGKIAEFTLPKLTVKTEEFRAGGMDAPVELDMGLEKLECDFSLDSVDRDGVVRSVIVRTRGQIKEVDYGSWKPGEKATLKFMAAVDYYKLEVDGETVHEIDVENMTRIVNGVDQVAARRAALGL